MTGGYYVAARRFHVDAGPELALAVGDALIKAKHIVRAAVARARTRPSRQHAPLSCKVSQAFVSTVARVDVCRRRSYPSSEARRTSGP
jgi:hypothetical protein